MISSIEELRNPALSSGFHHVRFERVAGRPKPYVAEVSSQGKARGATIQVGPHRATAEEAAQDYVDYLVNDQKVLTIEDIRNSARKSGFSNVSATSIKSGGGKFFAYVGRRDGTTGNAWQGRRRVTPEEAAQDYVDYINSQRVQSAPRLKSAGHRYDIDRTDRDPEVEAALGVLRDARAQREGVQGFVYCISDGEYIKVGYSVNPAKRVAELQTGNARPLRVLATMEGTLEDERRLHAQYAYNNVLQEWFEPDTDLLAEFDLADDDVRGGGLVSSEDATQ